MIKKCMQVFLRISSVIPLSVVCAFSAPNKIDQGSPQADPFETVYASFRLRDQTIFDGLAILSHTATIGVTIEAILGVKDFKQVNPKFQTEIETGTLAHMLDQLCSLDPRYTWLRDGNIVNFLPRAASKDPSFLLNRIIPVLTFDRLETADSAVMQAVHQLPDPKAQLVCLTIGPASSTHFANLWSAKFQDLTVREALDRIAQQLGPTYGWQLAGDIETPLLIFHEKIFESPH